MRVLVCMLSSYSSVAYLRSFMIFHMFNDKSNDTACGAYRSLDVDGRQWIGTKCIHTHIYAVFMKFIYDCMKCKHKIHSRIHSSRYHWSAHTCQVDSTIRQQVSLMHYSCTCSTCSCRIGAINENETTNYNINTTADDWLNFTGHFYSNSIMYIWTLHMYLSVHVWSVRCVTDGIKQQHILVYFARCQLTNDTDQFIVLGIHFHWYIQNGHCSVLFIFILVIFFVFFYCLSFRLNIFLIHSKLNGFPFWLANFSISDHHLLNLMDDGQCHLLNMNSVFFRKIRLDLTLAISKSNQVIDFIFVCERKKWFFARVLIWCKFNHFCIK